MHFIRGALMRRSIALITLALAALIGVLDAGAQAQAPADEGGIDVVQVEGMLDPPNVSLVRDAIGDASERGSTVLILQIHSPGGLDTDITPVVRAIQASAVPVVVWVGPSGSAARGAAAVLTEAAHVASVSPGSGVGPAHPLRLDRPDEPSADEIADDLAALAVERGRNADAAARLARDHLAADAAQRAGAVDLVAPTLGELIVALDERVVVTAAGPQLLDTARVVGEGVDRRRQPDQEIRFGRLQLDAQILHTLTSPSIAYVLFVVGAALIVFELYTAAIGIAGLTGAVAMVGAFIGFSHLPVHWWALAFIGVAMFGYAVDVQSGRVAVWTVIGTVALVVGSLTLYGGSSRLDPAWWVLLLTIVGTVLFMIGGLPTMIRTRFSTPTIGREGMVGEMGQAEVDVAPDGVVTIRGARWRARANRATPIRAGEPARVVAIDGLVLEVEPEEGGAEDYRERARKRRQPPT